MHSELIQNWLKIKICIYFWFRFHALHSFLIQIYKKEILRIMGFAFIFDSDVIPNWLKLRICIHFWFKCHSKLNHHKIWIHFCLKIMISYKNWLEIKICMHLWLRCVIFIRIWLWFSWSVLGLHRWDPWDADFGFASMAFGEDVHNCGCSL